MNKTPIEWTDFTVNPFRFRNLKTGKVGHYCEKISPGCKNCYSGTMQKGPYLSGLDFLPENFPKGELIFDRAVLKQVLRRQKPCRIFWCDMTDMFLAQYADHWIEECIWTMKETPHLTHQVLTKRSARLLSFLCERWELFRPNKSIYFGVSVEDEKRAEERRQDLQAVAELGWNTFVSYEPALGPVDWTGWQFLKQGIVGGESGTQAREFDVDWARSAVKQWRAMGVAPFVKQLGRIPYEMRASRPFSGVPINAEFYLELTDKKGGDMSEWPKDLQFLREGPFGAQPPKA